MKKIIYTAAFFTTIVFSSCSDNATDKNSTDSTDLDVLTTPGNSNLPANMKTDLNYVDADGKKQGKWIIYGKMSGDAAYNPTAKVLEGNYKDDLKDGEWTEYNPDGTVKRKVNYAAGQEVK